jgi:hypothetical protein
MNHSKELKTMVVKLLLALLINVLQSQINMIGMTDLILLIIENI